MADTPVFESSVVKSYPTAVGVGLTLRDESATTKTLIRADPDSNAAAEIGVGFGSSRSSGDALIGGQRPGEWVVLGSSAAAASFVDGIDRSGHVSVIDHTHSRALFRLSGAEAPRALEKVCSIDWADEMMPNGAVVSASLAKVGTDIIRADVNGERSYLIACDRSFGQYLFDALLDAGNEFGIGVS